MAANWPESSYNAIRVSQFRTKRLVLRPPAASDTFFWVNLCRDANTMRFVTPTGKELSFAQARNRWDDMLTHWKKHSCGVFVVEDRDKETPIGVAGVRWLATGELELDYLFQHQQWGLGLEDEATTACMTYAWREIGMEKLVALSHPKHFTKQKLLFSQGFLRLPERDGIYDGCYRLFFIRRF